MKKQPPQSRSEIARQLGKIGGDALAQSWKDLRARADAGDPQAQKELAARKRAMKARGRKGGRPRKEQT